MNKKLLVMAVAGACAGSSAAIAAPVVSIDGYVDVQMNVTDEADENNEGQFSVPETEVNFDTDNLFIAIASGDDNSYGIGQALFKYQIADGWNLKGGIFDSNLTADAAAAPDRQFTQNSALFGVLSDVGGEVLTGLSIAGAVGPATVTVAYANDSSVTPGPAVDGKNSVALLVNAAPMEGLDLELGLLTQDKDGDVTGSVGSLTDINGTYTINSFTVGLDYLAGADGTAGEFDNGYSFWAGYDLGNGVNVKARLESLSYVDGDDTDVTELYASYALTDNLSVALDLHNVDDGTDSFDTNTVEFVATF